jgi:hypothetical protein
MGGHRTKVRRLMCAEPNCGFEGEITDKTHDGLPSNVIRRKFEQKGWEVGTNEKSDICPACVEKRRVARRQKKSQHVAVLHHKPEPSPMNEAPPAISTEPPQKMSRADRQIIFHKLTEVYLDETQGYMSPWTDVAVARDLNVPQAWVATIRDENFGPARDNSDIREALARMDVIAKEAQVVVADVKTLREDGKSMVTRLNELSAKAIEIGKKLDAVLVMSDRIAKAVS